MMRYIVLIALLLVTSVASAQEDPMVIVREGIALQNRGNDAGALERFRRAWEIGHRPIALGQMGLAEQRLSHWIEAESHLRQVLAIHGDSWVERMRSQIDSAYAVVQQRVGTLEVNGNPASAHVLINGVEVGVLPLTEPLHVEAGTVALEVRAEGRYPVNRNVVITAGQLALETVELREQLVGETSSGSTPVLGPLFRPVIPAIVIAGAGVVLLGVGIGFGVGELPGHMTDLMPDTFFALRAVDYTLFIAGGVALAGGILWQILGSSTHGRRSAHLSVPETLSFSAGSGSAVLLTTWRF